MKKRCASCFEHGDGQAIDGWGASKSVIQFKCKVYNVFSCIDAFEFKTWSGMLTLLKAFESRAQSDQNIGGGDQMSKTQLHIFSKHENAREHCAKGAKMFMFSLL